jgi:hypothetical protein
MIFEAVIGQEKHEILIYPAEVQKAYVIHVRGIIACCAIGKFQGKFFSNTKWQITLK